MYVTHERQREHGGVFCMYTPSHASFSCAQLQSLRTKSGSCEGPKAESSDMMRVSESDFEHW